MLAEKAGIGKRLSFHVGRHTFASHLANAGTPLYMVAKLLGDKSLDMVHRVYTNTERTELIEAMKNWVPDKNESFRRVLAEAVFIFVKNL